MGRTVVARPHRYRVRRGAFRVRCRIPGHPIRSCRIVVLRKGRALGTGRARAHGARLPRLAVEVVLGRDGRALVAGRRRPWVNLAVTAKAADGTPVTSDKVRVRLRRQEATRRPGGAAPPAATRAS